MRLRLGVMVAAVWWGSLTGLGFVVVPVLFSYLPSPATAGAVAARLFTAQTWVGIVCGMLLLLVFNQKEATAQSISARPAIKYIATGLLVLVLVEFVVAPHIVGARAAGGIAAAELKFWHALGSALYLLQWLCAGMVLWSLSGFARQPVAKPTMP